MANCVLIALDLGQAIGLRGGHLEVVAVALDANRFAMPPASCLLSWPRDWLARVSSLAGLAPVIRMCARRPR